MKKSIMPAIFTLSLFLAAGLSAAVAAGPCAPSPKQSCYTLHRIPSVCAPYLKHCGEAPYIVPCGEAPYKKTCGEAPYLKGHCEAPYKITCGEASAILVECVPPQICAPPSKSFHK